MASRRSRLVEQSWLPVRVGLVILLAALACTGEKQADPTPIPGVTAKQAQVEFWTGQPGMDQLLMSREEIQEYNRLNTSSLDGPVVDLSSFFPRIPGPWVRQLILEIERPEETLYHADGSVATEQDWQTLEAARALERIPENVSLIRGVTRNRVDVRAWPSGPLLWDSPASREFEMLQQTVFDPGEPILVLHTSLDSVWAFVRGEVAAGWIPWDQVLPLGGEAWKAAARPGEFLVVLGPRLDLDPGTGAVLEYGMGALLPLASDGDSVLVPAALPGDGLVQVRVPAGAPVSPEYLPLTPRRILEQAFLMRGHRYGWGGLYRGVDCSSLVMRVFHCFGVRLPRNSGVQEAAAGRRVELEGLSREEKLKRLAQLTPGSLLHMQGHVMIYLGMLDGRAWAIHALAARGESEQDGGTRRVEVMQVVVSSTELLRSGGATLIDSLTSAKEVALPSAPELSRRSE